jgi:hypothetical protein
MLREEQNPFSKKKARSLIDRLAETKREELPTFGDAADKAANLMGCKSPAVNCPIQTASISDVEQGNELYGARK